MSLLISKLAIYYGIVLAGFLATHFIRLYGYRAFRNSKEAGFHFSEEKISEIHKFQSAMYLGWLLDLLLIGVLLFVVGMPNAEVFKNEMNGFLSALTWQLGPLLILLLLEFLRRIYEREHKIPNVLHSPQYK